MRSIFFTPGPAQLYPTFEQHLTTFVEQQLGSISHRSQAYRALHQFTVEQLRTLLSIPDTHQVLFLGSASEAWERILLNCVATHSHHLVNGSFSQKFYAYAQALGLEATQHTKPLGQGFNAADCAVPPSTELVAATHNETSTGVQMPIAEIHALKRAYPNTLLAVDMVSSAPYPALDYSLVDTAFFSVQKAFGLPAGLGVWIVNERCLAKAEQLRAERAHHIGAHHDLPTLWSNALKHETPATPNVMGIFLLGKIAEDLNRIGIESLRKETEVKAKLLYDFIEADERFSPFVTNPSHRSQTVIVADTVAPAANLIASLKQEGLVIGSGYGANKDRQMRIANFPATSLDQIEMLLQALGEA
jgi:phosphoserine aminotransferase